MPSPVINPDDYRMTVGEHLEELRRRLILGLLGLVGAMAVCLFFGDKVLILFCRPLYTVLEEKNLSSALKTDTLAEGFSIWLTVNLVTALALASPWLIYQMWLFIAAGLYPAERKYVTRYAPLSVGLLMSGMAFVYFLVLPWSLEFFIDFTSGIELPSNQIATTQPYERLLVPILKGDPPTPMDGELWIDSTSSRLKVAHDGKIRSARLTIDSLISPEQNLGDYIDLVIGMLITFGLSFQMPLVVLALERVGILSIPQLKELRRYVYLALTVLAAAITPGDVLTATVALIIPLALLYELGIWLAWWGKRKDSNDPTSPASE